MPSVTASAASPSKGSNHPALANSGTKTGSRLIRSVEESSAARRLASWVRWSVAPLGSSWMSMS